MFRNAHDLKVLSIGPRSETELFMLYAAEFHPDNVRGLDIVSYSELVDLGDMHHMPYPDNSFDVIILGWVLGYSHAPQKVANEVMRVAKPGAYVAIGCERAPPKERQKPSKSGIVLEGTYFESTQQYVDLFKDRVYDVPVRHEVHRKMQDQTCHVMAVIELK
ncbi:MAG: class I SAM-dependent methyltransferase [Rhodospirillales bacterium]|nr:class I SAM-dependent methyltransferase [Rhodospirillales bacterium]